MSAYKTYDNLGCVAEPPRHYSSEPIAADLASDPTRIAVAERFPLNQPIGAVAMENAVSVNVQ